MIRGLVVQTALEVRDTPELRATAERMAREELDRQIREENLVSTGAEETLTWSERTIYELYEDEDGDWFEDLDTPIGVVARLVIERPVYEGTVAHA
jgi:hypothetical protein